MNSVQVMGNLARDPQIRATKTGRAVASFSIAVNRNYTTPQGEQRELTDWINVVAWGNLAEAVGNQLKKGTRVFVEGRYSTRSYDTPDRSGSQYDRSSHWNEFPCFRSTAGSGICGQRRR